MTARFLSLLLASTLLLGAAPVQILDSAPPADWAAVDPADLLVMDLARGGRVVIALAPEFAPAHVGNIRALAHAKWFDGTAITRVQDNYVVQWGDPDGTRPPPGGIVGRRLPAEFDRVAAGLPITPLPYRDSFARRVGFVRGFPVAAAGGRAWMTRCYGIVGVGRDNSPDTGNGSELYAVIGHAPRALDRNIALVGRVVAGMDQIAALPRGTADLGFYAEPGQRVAIRQIRVAADLPSEDRPAYQWLRPESASFAAWVHARANRQDSFFVHPAGAVDLCNALPPVRPIAGGQP